MATFRHVGTIHAFFDKMVHGMTARGYERAFAESCFRQIEGFGTYGFPESHAASFAHLVYVSSWLKCRHPAAFACALLNSQPMGFYAPAQIVRDAREHGVEVRAPDVNASQWDCTLDRDARLQLGFRLISSFREDWAAALMSARGPGFPDFSSLARSLIPHPALVLLAEADAMRSLGLDRRAALWQVRGLAEAAPLPLFAHLPVAAAEAGLPRMPLPEHVVADYQSTGLSLKAHPLRFLRASLARAGVRSCAEAAIQPDGAAIRVAGVVLVRQRPGSASGVIFATIEDETGIANVVVWPSLIERFRREIIGSALLEVAGRIQRSPEGIVHVVAETLHDRTAELRDLDDSETMATPLAHADAMPPAPSARSGAASGPRHPRDVRPLPRSRDFH
jgi:error-prone DNA polymerase